jgi:hypothetical protein
LAQVPNPSDRKNRFLASSSWQCLEPSLDSHYPEESSIEKEYIFEPHLEGDQRRKELFSAPLREVISCQKDFDFRECSLPFKGKEPKSAPPPLSLSDGVSAPLPNTPATAATATATTVTETTAAAPAPTSSP